MSMMMPEEDPMKMMAPPDPSALPIDVDPGMFSTTPPELPPAPRMPMMGGGGMGMMGGGMMGGAAPAPPGSPPGPPLQMGGGGGMVPPMGTPGGYPPQPQTPAAPGDPGDEVLLEAFRAAAMRPR
jgi:hypothetical protein